MDESTFGREVLERSRRMPVLVDFWAVWCGPCRTLGPVLEKLALEMQGRFYLAKIDSDRDPELARRYGVRGIPAVKLFVDGAVVDEFTGALPESQVRRFLDQALPGPADKLVGVGRQAEEGGSWEQAVAFYREALDHDAEHVAALLGLSRGLLELGQNEEAQLTLNRLKPHDRDRVEARTLAARLAFGAAESDLEQWLERVAHHPEDLEALMGLGEALVARERYAEGMERFLEVVRRDRGYGEDAGRKALVRVFDLLGPGHPLIPKFRQRLSALLFA
ncbi:MAG: tetratricopeptide repeat protein [Magnetococcales bacterium]|nr:tetratricopeptide repeat protein [Magnetococcales bacterium]NGZ05541.1 tetratricopeptide repeat protein [Magnetococcales bacterium]